MGITVFPNGVGNRPLTDLLGEMPIQDPISIHTFFDDFDKFEFPAGVAPPVTNQDMASGWRVYNSQGSQSYVRATDSTSGNGQQGGRIQLLAQDPTITSNLGLQTQNSGFTLQLGSELWMEARMANQNAGGTDNQMFGGLLTTNDSPVGGTRTELGFKKVQSDNDWRFQYHLDDDNILNPVIATIDDGNMHIFQFHWDGLTKMTFGVDGENQSEIVTDLPANNNTKVLAPTLFVHNVSTNIRQLEVDYILVVQRLDNRKV